MNILLFDVDGTIAEPGRHINEEILNKIDILKSHFDIGIVGGGNLARILNQLGGLKFNHYFTECGCLYYRMIDSEIKEIHRKDIRLHPLYSKINMLVKAALKYLSSVNYLLTGHFIDLRCGIIYVSLIGLAANQTERDYFIKIDKQEGHRNKLLRILFNKAKEIGIAEDVDIVIGGSVGIGIYPKEWDKVQVVDYLPQYDEIYYFGDKYESDGNDYKLLNHPRVHGFAVDSPNDTLKILEEKFHV